MDYLFSVFRTRKVLVVLAFLVLVAVGGLWLRSARLDESTKSRFLARILDGLGGEVALPAAGSSMVAIEASIDSVSSFFYRRSGVALSRETKTRLAGLEDNVLNGAGRRITADEWVASLTSTAMERLSTLTDAEIDGMSKTLCGFSDADLPEAFPHDRVKLRASVGSNMSPADFAKEVRTVRNSNDLPSFETTARGKIKEIVTDRLQCFSRAVPNRFGDTWNQANGTLGNLTPVQAVLVAYSAASDDYLADSATNLQKRMNSMAGFLEQKFGRFPTSEGRFAYGVNGYIYSSPLDVLFGDAVVARLLDRLEERCKR